MTTFEWGSVLLGSLVVSMTGYAQLRVDVPTSRELARAIGDADSCITYNWARFQSNPAGCDLILEGDANNKTWPVGCPTNNCNIPVAACNYESTATARWCECSFGNAPCCSMATVNANGQVTGVTCFKNGCAVDCDLVLWQLGAFYACWC